MEIQRPRPLFRWCNDAPLSVQHVILECPLLDAVRTDVGKEPAALVLYVVKEMVYLMKFETFSLSGYFPGDVCLSLPESKDITFNEWMLPSCVNASETTNSTLVWSG